MFEINTSNVFFLKSYVIFPFCGSIFLLRAFGISRDANNPIPMPFEQRRNCCAAEENRVRNQASLSAGIFHYKTHSGAAADLSHPP